MTSAYAHLRVGDTVKRVNKEVGSPEPDVAIIDEVIHVSNEDLRIQFTRIRVDSRNRWYSDAVFYELNEHWVKIEPINPLEVL